VKRIVVGLDPGTGVSSPTGFAAFDPDSRDLLYHSNLVSKHKPLSTRIKDIAEQVADGLATIDPDVEVFVFTETFMMRGKSGQNLQRLIGALTAAVPYQYQPVGEVYNTTVKKVVAGHGAADKSQVAAGVYAWGSENAETKLQLDALIARGEWDVLDAFAIGLAGWLIKNADQDSKTAARSSTTSK
jgi:Holliday junction resolvasome RuvABC endonuclease subunit